MSTLVIRTNRLLCMRCRKTVSKGTTRNATPFVMARRPKSSMISWKIKCPNCGATIVFHQKLLTPANVRENLAEVIAGLDGMFASEAIWTDSVQQEVDNSATVALLPAQLNYDKLGRDFWHPLEWQMIEEALEDLLGLRQSLQTAQLSQSPRELGGNGRVSVYGQLSTDGQAIYFLGKAGFWA